MANGRRFAVPQPWNECLSRDLENSTDEDRAMNEPLQHDTRGPLVYISLCETLNIAQDPLVCVAEETPIAFRYNGFAHAVMMGSPEDLEDFAIGFSLSEGIIETTGPLPGTSITQRDDGITIDVFLGGDDFHRYLAGRRVRQLHGHTSCGLCGVKDLADVRRPTPRVPCAAPLDLALICSTLTALRQRQPVSRQTRGAHASAWVDAEGQLHSGREDVGRHNSLDKLIGSLLRSGGPQPEGFFLITSRCSFEMVQKAVAAGFPTLVSVGAPTAYAIRLAAAAGLTLYALSRDGEPLLFTSPAISENRVWPELAS
jgi:FdhD protein